MLIWATYYIIFRDNLCTTRNTRARQWQGSKFMMDGWLLIALVFHNLQTQCMIHSTRVYYYYYYSQPPGFTGFVGLHTIISRTHARCNHHWFGLWLWAELHSVINIWQNPWLTCCVVSLWVIKSKHSTIEYMYPVGQRGRSDGTGCLSTSTETIYSGEEEADSHFIWGHAPLAKTDSEYEQRN